MASGLLKIRKSTFGRVFNPVPYYSAVNRHKISADINI